MAEAQPTLEASNGAPAATPPALGQTPAGGAVTPGGAVAVPPAAAPLPPPVQQQATPIERVPTRKLIGDEDDIPKDVDLLEMSSKALKNRLERFSRAQLRERFGVDNFDEIKARLDRAAQLEQQAEEKRLAELSEADRYREMYSRAEAARVAAEQQLTQYQESRMIEDQDRRVISIAANHVKPKHFNYVTTELARHLQTLEEEELRDPDAYIEGWFQKWTQENPEFGKDFGATPPAPVQAVPAPLPQRAVPVTNTPTLTRPSTTQPAGAQLQKTAAPGRPNSMNENEWREYKKVNNLRW